MKQELERSLNELLKSEFGLNLPAILIPGRPEYGDYTSTIAWQLANNQLGDAWTYAEALVAHFPTNPYVKIEAHPPAYLNFRYLPAFWVQEIRYLLRLKSSIDPVKIQDLSMRYAYERNALVLPHLIQPKRFTWPRSCWDSPAHLMMLALVKYRDYFSDLSSSKKLSDGLNYLKNLARTIHYLYNEVTLVTHDAQKDQALAAVLQASQNAIAQGLNLAGGN